MSVLSRATTWIGQSAMRLAEALAALAETALPASRPQAIPVRARDGRARHG